MRAPPRENLTPTETRLITWLASEGRSSVDLIADADVLARLSAKPRDVLYGLRRKGLAHPIQAGRFLVNVDERPSRNARVDALDPLAAIILRRLPHAWYLSWHSALWHHGLIDQQSSRLYVAITVRKRPARVGRSDIRFVTVQPRKFFGFETIDDFEQPVNIATIEKTLVDSFDQPRYAAPLPVIANAMNDAWRTDRLNSDALVDAALRFESPVLNRRIGYFMDLYGIKGADPLSLRIGRKSAVPLTPGRQPGPGHPPVNPRWLVYEEPDVIGAALELK
jgi:predicted transcriptional regulator of viral defense system